MIVGMLTGARAALAAAVEGIRNRKLADSNGAVLGIIWHESAGHRRVIGGSSVICTLKLLTLADDRDTCTVAATELF